MASTSKAPATDDEEAQKQDKAKAKTSEGRSDCLLSFCRIVNVISGIAALLCFVAHGMALTSTDVSDSSPLQPSSHLLLQLLRIYSMATAVLCVLIETEAEWVLTWVRAAEGWLGRGLLQGFLALLTLQLANSNGTTDFDRSLGIYRLVAGLIITATAGFYILGGLLCLGTIKKARYRRIAERARMERDMELLERQREELQQMLESYSKA